MRAEVVVDFLLCLLGLFLFGLVLGVQILGALHAHLLIDFTSISCSSVLLLVPGASVASCNLCWPMSSSTMACLMRSQHPSPCSLISTLICAALHTSLESPAVGSARECASCALRETTSCASRQSSVHHCLLQKATLLSALFRTVARVSPCIVVATLRSASPLRIRSAHTCSENGILLLVFGTLLRRGPLRPSTPLCDTLSSCGR